MAVRKAKGLIGAAHESPEWLMDLGRRMNIPFELPFLPRVWLNSTPSFRSLILNCSPSSCPDLHTSPPPPPLPSPLSLSPPCFSSPLNTRYFPHLPPFSRSLLAVFSDKCQRPTPRHPSASSADPLSAPTPECVQAAHLINHTVETRLSSSSSTVAAEAAAMAERGASAAAAASGGPGGTRGPASAAPAAAAAAFAGADPPVAASRGVGVTVLGSATTGAAAGGGANGGGVAASSSSVKEQQPIAATAARTYSPDSRTPAIRAAPAPRPAARAPAPAPAPAATERWGWGKSNSSSSRGLWGKINKGAGKKDAKKKVQKLPEASKAERNSIMDGTLVPASRAVNPPMSRNPMFEPVGASKRRAARQPGLRVPMCIKTVKVQFGDTLAEIAQNHRTSIRDLQRLNNLRSDFIVEGDTLIVSCCECYLGDLRWANQRRSVPELRPGIRRTCRPLFSRLSPSSTLPKLPARLGVGGPAAGAIVKAGSAAGGRVSLLEGRWRRGPKGFPKSMDGWRWRWRRGPKGFPKSMDGWLRFNCPVVDGCVMGAGKGDRVGVECRGEGERMGEKGREGWEGGGGGKVTQNIPGGRIVAGGGQGGERWGGGRKWGGEGGGGVDLAAEFGAPVLASDKGVVTYGKLVTIAHDNGFTTRYGHCCIINARVGQRVARGQQVACVGATGRATGPHLHFEGKRTIGLLFPHCTHPLTLPPSRPHLCVGAIGRATGPHLHFKGPHLPPFAFLSSSLSLLFPVLFLLSTHTYQSLPPCSISYLSFSFPHPMASHTSPPLFPSVIFLALCSPQERGSIGSVQVVQSMTG
ncbi:unnamed protein product [Closterium sp. NIES-65]|nr:unnamed protein product [Closterium sp. NIES-65]